MFMHDYPRPSTPEPAIFVNISVARFVATLLFHLPFSRPREFDDEAARERAKAKRREKLRADRAQGKRPERKKPPADNFFEGEDFVNAEARAQGSTGSEAWCAPKGKVPCPSNSGPFPKCEVSVGFSVG